MEYSLDNIDENCLDEFGYTRLSDAVSGGILYEMTKTGIVGRLQAQFDIKIENTIGRGGWGSYQPPITLELFNSNNSFIHASNPDYDNSGIITPAYPGGFNLNKMPFTALKTGQSATIALDYTGGAFDGNTFTRFARIVGSNMVYVDEQGNVVIGPYKNPDFVGFDQTGMVKISCKQVPYYSLIKSSALQPFYIDKLRIFYNNGQDTPGIPPPFPSRQVAEPMFLFSKTFLGKQTENVINPGSYKRPSQYQNYIIDVPIKFQVDGESGIKYTVHSPDINTNEVKMTVGFVMSLSRYYKHELKPL